MKRQALRTLVFGLMVALGMWGGASVGWAGEPTTLTTYGMPEEGPWQEVFQVFCKEHNCRHVDTDMTSAQAITKFVAERNRPVATATEVGVLFGPLAVQQEAALAYRNASWDRLPDWAKDAGGNWFAVYAGVPTFLVNTAVVKTTPQSWQDLLKPEFKNSVAFKDPRESGTAVAMLLAATAASGGGPGNLTPGISYFKKLFQAGNVKAISPSTSNIQKGEVPVTIRYDHENLITRERFKKELKLEVVMPSDGSLYTPSVVVLNRFAPDPALAKAFADFLVSDRGQVILARSLTRPIRTIAGNLEVPADIRAQWLPEDLYRNRVRTVQKWEGFSIDAIRDRWTNEVLAR